MTGHTFKVGDLVRCSGVRSDVNGTVRLLAWPPDSSDEVPVQSPCGSYHIASVYDLRPLPPFEPVERWMPLMEDGTLGWDIASEPKHFRGYAKVVKVLISPAEDQAHPSQDGAA